MARPLPVPAAGAGLQALRDELEGDLRQLEEENGEIDMLMEQVLLEIDRHQARRTKSEQRIAELEVSTQADPAELNEARDNLLAHTRREMLFDTQRQVLEGKQRLLTRYIQRITEIDDSLAALGGDPGRPAPAGSAGLRPLAQAAGGSGAPGMNRPAAELRDREELRREIVRQIHDGPAQSIANIGLQAEIVERLIEKDDPRAIEEIEQLRRLVQQALDTTKSFIFQIRPMVLDDLGLGPTVRRAAADQAQQSGINVDFDSRGVEQRLDPDIESALYRSLQEAISGYLALRPPSVLVRMDWSETEVVATVEGTWPRLSPEGQAEFSQAAAGREADTPPALLAMMAEKRSADREADRAARSLPRERVAEMEHRASALGFRLTVRDEGQAVELVAPIRRQG
jgi:two-component system sensor histidine kinase DegS